MRLLINVVFELLSRIHSLCVEYRQASPFQNPSPHLYLAQVFPDFNIITTFWYSKFLCYLVLPYNALTFYHWTVTFYYLSAAKLTS